MTSNAPAATLKVDRVPGPRGLPLLGVAPALASDPLGFLAKLVDRYGDVAAFRLGRSPAMLINAPDLVRTVLLERPKVFGLSPKYEKLKYIIGSGLTASDGADWRRRRKVDQQVMSTAAIDAVIPAFAARAARVADAWLATGTSVDAAESMFALTLANIFGTMFGQAPWPEAAMLEDVEIISREMGKRMLSPVPFLDRLPTPGNRALAAAKARLDATIAQLIRQHTVSDDAGDLLTRLKSSRSDEGTASFSEQEIQDEIITFALAGHETTAATLTWFWAAMATFPEIAQRVREEATAWLASGAAWTMAGLSAAKYTRAVLDEVMRLYAPAWIISRYALEDCELGGFFCRTGTVLFVSPYLLHRHREYWQRPEAFDPERFLDRNQVASGKKAYIPFGLGARACVGSQFALAEALATVLVVMAKCSFSGVHMRDIGLEPNVVLRPRGAVKLNIKGLSR